jgi:hypothetical protein
MQTIYLDISNKGVIPCIQAKQSEVGRKFLAVITDNGIPYNIHDNSLLSVWYEGDTDAGNYSSIEEKSAFGIDGNKVSVELVAQMLLKPGNGELCLSITHGDGGETNTWNIPYCVEYKPGAGSSVPTEYYTALTEAGATAAQAAGEAKMAAEQAKEAVFGYVKSDGSVPMTGSLPMGGNKITGLALPTNNGDAVNLDFVTALANKLVPIGYMFHWCPVEESNIDLSTSEKVKEHFGFGVWEQTKDTFLLASGDKYAIGITGGSESHTLTVEEMPSHNHSPAATTPSYQPLVGGSSEPGSLNNAAYVKYNTGNNSQTTFETGYSGGGVAFDIMPPYQTVYIWKRIA